MVQSTQPFPLYNGSLSSSMLWGCKQNSFFKCWHKDQRVLSCQTILDYNNLKNEFTKIKFAITMPDILKLLYLYSLDSGASLLRRFCPTFNMWLTEKQEEKPCQIKQVQKNSQVLITCSCLTCIYSTSVISHIINENQDT